MPKYDKADIERRMHGAVESLKHDLSGLRTGRANVALLDPVMVEVYGSMMPLNQVATVNAPEPRMLSVQVWDKANVIPVEKGIAKANLGLNPMIDGQTIRLPVGGDKPIGIKGRSTQGVIVFDTAEGEKVMSVEHIKEPEGDEEEPEAPDAPEAPVTE